MAFIVIIFICYAVVAGIRKTKVPNEWLPLISGGIGLLLSLLARFVFPELVDTSVLTVLLYGFICGLAATGSNQVVKQTLKFFKDKYGVEISLPTISKQDKE